MANTCYPYTEVIVLDLKEAYGDYSTTVSVVGITATMASYLCMRILSQSKLKSTMLEAVLNVTAYGLWATSFVNMFIDKHIGSKLGKLEITIEYGCETHKAIRQGVEYTWESPSLAGIDIRSI